MKKILMLAFATMLISGAAFAGGKKCGKGKDCCKKEAKKSAKGDTKKETTVVSKA